MYFYELHEGDGDIFSDVLLAHDAEYPAEEFFELVQSVRRQVLDRFEHDTLVEAIAAQLEREHGFLFVSDDRLTAAVNVSRDDDDNFLAEIDDPPFVEVAEDGEFRSVRAELDLRDDDLIN